MRALVQQRYGGSEVLHLDAAWPCPEPTAGMIRVRILACGANASDWEFITGSPAYARIGGLFRSGQRVLGSDIVGVVDKLGAGVEGFKPGDRVLADTFGRFGGFAEFTVAPAKLWVKVPDDMSATSLAALPQSGTIALQALAQGVQKGQTILINGAGGGTGTLALQLAKSAGLQVTAVDNHHKRALLTKLGADRVLDYAEQDFVTEHYRYDLILDLFGTRSAKQIRQALASPGRYLLVGGEMSALWSVLLDSLTRSPWSPQKCTVFAVDQGPKRLGTLCEHLQHGTLLPVIGEVSTLEDAPAALARMGAGQIPGKLIVTP